MMRISVVVFLFVFLACTAFPQEKSDESKKKVKKETYSEEHLKTKKRTGGQDFDYKKLIDEEKKRTLEKLRKYPDDEFIRLRREYSAKKNALMNKIFALHPEVKQIQNPSERNKLIEKYSLEIKKTDKKLYEESMKAENDYLQYLLEKNYRLKELYEKIKSSE